MIQKCSYLAVLEVFFQEPTAVHFIREISRKIGLAPTSVKKHIDELEKEGLIMPKESKPFNGFVANRDETKFIFYKKAFNLLSLFELNEAIIQDLFPKAIVLFGSYQRGEDVEGSDIDLLILSNVKKELLLDKFEKKFKRKIHLTFVKDLKELDEPVRKNVKKGIILHGELDG